MLVDVVSRSAHVFIFPASLCLLVDAFNPPTFKVVINVYDPITIFLIVLGLFSIGLVFVSIQPVYVFWLEHLTHLHLN